MKFSGQQLNTRMALSGVSEGSDANDPRKAHSNKKPVRLFGREIELTNQ